jgi:hypothetical protein
MWQETEVYSRFAQNTVCITVCICKAALGCTSSTVALYSVTLLRLSSKASNQDDCDAFMQGCTRMHWAIKHTCMGLHISISGCVLGVQTAALGSVVKQVSAHQQKNMQRHPTPGCKAAHSSKAAHARTAGQTHCNVSVTVLCSASGEVGLCRVRVHCNTCHHGCISSGWLFITDHCVSSSLQVVLQLVDGECQQNK